MKTAEQELSDDEWAKARAERRAARPLREKMREALQRPTVHPEPSSAAAPTSGTSTSASWCDLIRIHRVWKRVLPIRDRGWGPHELESLVGDTPRKEADR